MQKRQQRICGHARGFTLVELLVVMAALTVLAALTIPTLKTILQGQKVTNASRIVQAHLDAARIRAVSSGRPVAAILERNANDSNTVTRLSVGQVFPPYQGDTVDAAGTLEDAYGYSTMNGRYETGTGLTDGYYDRITIPRISASLLEAGVIGPGDFIQLGDRESLFVIRDVQSIVAGTIAVDFYNPPVALASGVELNAQELQLPIRTNPQSKFRVFRKPEKSFVQASVLPRGTCIDMTVSGMGPAGFQFSSTGFSSLSIVFSPDGTVSYLTDGTPAPTNPTGIIHLLVGKTDQVALGNELAQLDPNDTGTFNANLNDEGNSWVSVNPYTGNVFSSQIQTGSEGTTIAGRLPISRAYATAGFNFSEN